MILLGIISFLLEPVSGSNVQGNLLALVSGISFSVLILFFGADYGISGLGLISLLNLGILPVVAFLVPWDTAPYIMDAKSWVFLIILGSVQIALAYVFFYAGRKRIPPVDSSIFTLIEPILNPIWVFLSIGERPTRYAFIGYALIMAALIITVIIEKRRSLESNSIPQGDIV